MIAIGRAIPLRTRHRVLRRLSRQRGGQFGAALGLLLVLAFTAGPLLWYASPTELHPDNPLAALSVAHPLGTDELGRDELARLLAAGGRTLISVLGILGLTVAVGLVLGVIAGVFGGVVDMVITRVYDVFLAFPPVVFALVVLTVLGPGFINLVIALAVTNAGLFVRLARSYTRTARQRPVVIAARMAGIPWWRVIAGHVIPEPLTKLLVVAALAGGHVAASLAGLSFLGFGAQPPTPELGLMLSDARLYLASSPTLILAPGLVIVALVISFNFVGIALDDAMRGASPR